MMLINLLPWRERQIQRRNRLFYSQGVLVGMTSAALLFFAHFYFLKLIAKEEERWVHVLREEEKLRASLEEIRNHEKMKIGLKAQLKLIRSLNKDQIDIMAWLERLSKVMPASTCLNRITTKSKTLTLEGFAQTNGAISALLKNLEGEDGSVSRLSKPKLIEVAADKKTPYLRFKIVVSEGEV